MPISLCKTLGIGEMKPTNISLQLAYKSVKYPVGVLEDVLVRISELYIPVDSVIMEIKKDFQIPILIGRPFLSTVGDIINVKIGKLTFEVGKGRIEFILEKLMKSPSLRALVVWSMSLMLAYKRAHLNPRRDMLV